MTLENQDVNNDEGKKHLPGNELQRLSFAKVLNLKFQQQPLWTTVTHDPNTTLGHRYG